MDERQAKLLWDALDALNQVQTFIGSRTFDDYLSDDMLRAAVERKLEGWT